MLTLAFPAAYTNDCGRWCSRFPSSRNLIYSGQATKGLWQLFTVRGRSVSHVG